MKKIRIGQIGIGHNHGSGKMQAIRKYPDLFEVVGFSETDEHWLSERRKAKCYADLPLLSEDEILEKSDAVLVECDVWNLTKTALRCVRAGKHVHMDKPASGTVKEFAELLREAESSRLQFQMAYMYRYNPAVEKALEMARSGELGEIYEIVAEMSTNHSDPYRQWLGHFKGGSMYIFGSHLIDLIVALLGEPERVTPFILQSGKNGIMSDDNTAAVLEYAHTMARVVNSSVENNGFGRRQFTICGSNGTAEILPLERPTRMFLSLPPESETKIYGEVRSPVDIPQIGESDRYDLMMKDFAYCILGECAPRYSYAHDLAVHRTILRACGYEKL